MKQGIIYSELKQGSRILHCPENLGNNAKRLSDHEKKLGFNSWSISLKKDAYGFKADQTLVKGGSFILGELARWRLLWIAIFSYDIIHFNNGKTIMPHRVPFSSVRARTNTLIALFYSIYAGIFEGLDLPILKAFGKTIYFTYQGSDARYSSHYTKLHNEDVLAGLNPDYLSPKADKYKKRRIARSEKFADGIYCLNPDLLRNFTSKASFLPYYNVDINLIETHSIFDKPTIHVVHAPSKRDIKGSTYIINALNKICKDNPNVDFTLVENMINDDAQRIYKTADLFIDQLIVGWYGGVAVELMARGVPVMCFLEDTSDIENVQELVKEIPIIATSIDTLETDLKDILSLEPNKINSISQAGLKFVRAHHSRNHNNCEKRN